MGARPGGASPAQRFYNTPFIRELIRIETLIAQRYGRTFSLIAIEMGGFDTLQRELGSKEAMLEFLKDVATTIMSSTRQCDIVGMINKKDFLLMLPETDYFGALVATRRLRRHLRERYSGRPVDFALAPVTCPQDGSDFEELLHRAFSEAREYRRSLIHTMGLEDKGFYECVEILLEGVLPGGEEWNRLSQFSSAFITRLQDVVLKEIIRTPKAKGILYLSSFAKEDLLDSFLRELEGMDEVRTQIHIVDGGSLQDYPETVHLIRRDGHLPDLPFILFFRRDFAYAFLCKEEGGRVLGFHTMDPFLVEGLIGKLKDHCVEKGLL